VAEASSWRGHHPEAAATAVQGAHGVATGCTPEASEVTVVTGGDPADTTTVGSPMHSGASPQRPQLKRAGLDTPIAEGVPAMEASNGKDALVHNGSGPPLGDWAGQGMVLSGGKGDLPNLGFVGGMPDVPMGGSPRTELGTDPLGGGLPLNDGANMEGPDV
jgi:hypothetical protein